MNIGIFFIGIDRYIELYDDFKKSFDNSFLKENNKKYFIITDKKDFICKNNEELIIVNDLKEYRLINLKRFEYFLKCNVSDMDYLYFFNANSICRKEVFDEDIIPTKEHNYLCGSWLSFYEDYNPCDTNENSSCYMIPLDKKHAFRGGLLGGKKEEFVEMCKSCIKMIENNGDYIPKWNDEAYFNKYVENKNIMKIDNNIFDYINTKEVKIYARNKKNIFGEEYLRNRKHY